MKLTIPTDRLPDILFIQSVTNQDRGSKPCIHNSLTRMPA